MPVQPYRLRCPAVSFDERSFSAMQRAELSHGESMNYLCAAIDRHFNHEEHYGKGAIFSLESHQHGWDVFSQVREGDTVYLIAPNRIVKQGYRVMRVRRGEDHVVVYSDQVIANPAIPYQTFIKRHALSDNRISSIGNMLRGFNVVAFELVSGTKKAPRSGALTEQAGDQ